MVGSGDSLHPDLSVIAGHALLDTFTDIVVELVERHLRAALLFGELHQGRVERDGTEPVVGAVARDHRLRGGRIELSALGEVAIEARLARPQRRARPGAG